MCLKSGFDGFALIVLHSAVDHFEAVVAGKTLSRQQIVQPFLCGPVLRKNDDAFFVPLAVGAKGSVQPVDECLCFAIWPQAGLVRVFT